MKRRLIKAVLATVAALGFFATARTAQAQEIQLTGPLRGAPAVRHLRLYREGRFEVAPAVSFTLLDEYRRTIIVGGRLTYYIKDWIGIGVWGGYGVASLTTDLTDRIDAVYQNLQGGDPLTAVNVNHTNPNYPYGGYASFADQTAKMDWIVAPQVTFTPFRGKLAIFNKVFVDTDLYVAGGVGVVGIEERGACGAQDQVACTDPNSFKLASQTKIAPTFGVGLDFFLTGMLSLGVEYRALPFSWNRAGFDSKGAGPNGNFPDLKIDGKDDTFRFNQLVTILLGFSFPTQPSLSE